MVSLGDIVRIITPQNIIPNNDNDEASASPDTQEYLVVRKKESGNCALVPINIDGKELNKKKKLKLMKAQFSDGTDICVNYLNFIYVHIDKLVPTEHRMRNKHFYWDVSEAHRIHMRDIQRANIQYKLDVQKKKEQELQKIRSDPNKIAKLTAEYEIASLNNDRRKMNKIENLLGFAPMRQGTYSKAASFSSSGFLHPVSGGKFSSK